MTNLKLKKIKKISRVPKCHKRKRGEKKEGKGEGKNLLQKKKKIAAQN